MSAVDSAGRSTSSIRPRFGGQNIAVRAAHRFYRDSWETPRRARIRSAFLAKGASWKNLPGGDAEMHTLLCHRDVEMGMCAALSFAFTCGRRFRWVVHDDGSLTAQDVARINETIPGTRVIDRKTADERARRECSQLRYSQVYRDRQVMALKLVDVRIWAESARIAYLDSDICFFRQPEFFLRALRGEAAGSYFNRDIKDSYVLSRPEIDRRTGIAAPEKINAGLWVMNRDDIDLDRIEEWLAGPAFSDCRYAYTLDQTMIAMLGAVSGHGIAHLPPEYDVDLTKPVEGSVCKHYVGAIRHGFELEGLATLLRASDD
jgi:hypothetical protein